MVFGGVARTFGELDERARRLASLLGGLGAGPGRPVAAILPNGVEIFEVAMAAAMLDAPFLPVNWHLRSAELAYILADAGASVVVGHGDLAHDLSAALTEHAVPSLVVGAGYEEAVDGAEPLTDGDTGGGPELMFYTSGTTARPKGVVHAAMSADEGRRRAMEGQVALWGWTEDDVYVMSGPAYHASHLGWSLCALYVGATTVVTEQFEARSWLGEVERRRGTRTFMVPAHFIRILELPEEDRAAMDLTSLALIVHAAAPCPVAVKFKMMEAFPHAGIHELYGASEGGATKISPEEWRARPGSVGRPWPGVEIRILDEEGAPVATGEPGLVYIRPAGPQRFSYRNDAEATERAWRRRRLHGGRHRLPRRGRLPHHHRPGVGHGPVGRGQHRAPRDRGGAVRTSRRGGLRRLRHSRRARRRAAEGDGPAAHRGGPGRTGGVRGRPIGQVQGPQGVGGGRRAPAGPQRQGAQAPTQPGPPAR